MGRRELKRLKQSTLVTLWQILSGWGFRVNEHYRYNATLGSVKFRNGKDELTGKQTWEGGSEIVLMDLAPMPSDPDYERLGSLEFTGAFIEEASEVEEKAKEVTLSRIRYKLEEFGLIPKLLMTCNPHKGHLYREFYKPWKKKTLPKDKAFLKSLVQDNPHQSPHYIKSLQKIKDKVLKARLLLGDWEYAETDRALFNYDALTDMFTYQADEDDDKTQYLTCDVARFGRDKAVIKRWEGLESVETIVYHRSAMPTLETEILVLAQKHKIPMSRVLVDEGGVGGGIVDHLQCKGFVSNATPIEPKKKKELKEVEYKINYQNLKTQCYYVLAEKVNDGLIGIRCESVQMKEEIIEELEIVAAVDIDKDQKLRITSKDDIKAAIGRSPDFADTLMMRMWFEVRPVKKVAKVYTSNPLG